MLTLSRPSRARSTTTPAAREFRRPLAGAWHVVLSYLYPRFGSAFTGGYIPPPSSTAVKRPQGVTEFSPRRCEAEPGVRRGRKYPNKSPQRGGGLQSLHRLAPAQMGYQPYDENAHPYRNVGKDKG